MEYTNLFGQGLSNKSEQSLFKQQRFLRFPYQISSPKQPSFLHNRGCPLGVSRVTSSVYVCGAHALPGAVKALRPGLVVNAAPELPPPPEDCAPRIYVPLLDTPNADMHPFMERVADLIHEVGFDSGTLQF